MLTGILFPSGGKMKVLGFNLVMIARNLLIILIGFGQSHSCGITSTDRYLQSFSKIYELKPKDYKARLDFS